MATFREKLELLIDANVAGFIAAMDKAGAAADKNLGKETTGKLDQLAGKFTVMGAAAVGGAAVAAAGLGKLAAVAGEAQVAQAKLDNSIANSSQKFSDNGAAVSDLASELQKKVAADDESIRSGQSVLIQFGLTEDQVLRLTPLIVDLSRKMGIDLDTAAKQVGKSATGSQGALKKLGIDVKDLGEGSTDAEKTISALNKTVGGFAQAEGRTFSGQLEILKNQLSELGESVGQGAAGTLQSIVGSANDLLSSLNDVNPGITAAVGSFATLATIGVGGIGGASLIAGQLIGLRDNFSGLLKDGEGNLNSFGSKVMDAEGKLTKFGQAAKVAGGLTIGVAVVAAVVEIGNQFNKASQDAEKFAKSLDVLSGARGGDKGAATGDLLNSLTGSLDEWSQGLDKSTKSLNFGERLQLVVTNPLEAAARGWNIILGNNSDLIGRTASGLAVDLNQGTEALDKLRDAANPTATQGFLEGLKSLKGETPEATAAIGELYTQTAILYNQQIKSAAGQRDAAAATKQQVDATREAGLATGEYAATAADLKDISDELTLSQKDLTAAFDGNQAAAKGFSGALAFVTNNASASIDAAQQVGKSINDAFRDSKDAKGDVVPAAIKALPAEFDAATAALGGYSEQQNKAIDALQAYGSAAQNQLQVLISQGASNEEITRQAQGYADLVRNTLIPQFEAQGLSLADATAKAEGYVAQLGLTPAQIETQLKLSGIEEARQKLQFLQGDFDNLPAEKRAEIYAAVQRGEWDQALKIYNDFKDKQVQVGINVAVQQQVARNQSGVPYSIPAIEAATGKDINNNGVVGKADGGVAVAAYADGGMRNKLPTQAIIQPSVAGNLVQWAEPSTGGEAFIPLSPAKRARSLDIWVETGRRLGVMPMDQQAPRLSVNVQSSATPRPETPTLNVAAPNVKIPPIIVPPINVPASQATATPQSTTFAPTFNINGSDPTTTASESVRKLRDLAFLGA